MFKPDVEKVQELMEKRWIANDFTKLTEPVDGVSEIYIAVQLSDESCQDWEQFRLMHLEPAFMSLKHGVRDEENNEYYQVLVECKDNALIVSSSRGLLPETVATDIEG